MNNATSTPTLAELLAAIQAPAVTSSNGEYIKAGDLEGETFSILDIKKQKSKKFGTDQVVFSILVDNQERLLAMSPTPEREAMLKAKGAFVALSAEQPLTLVKTPTPGGKYTWKFASV